MVVPLSGISKSVDWQSTPATTIAPGAAWYMSVPGWCLHGANRWLLTYISAVHNPCQLQYLHQVGIRDDEVSPR